MNPTGSRMPIEVLDANGTDKLTTTTTREPSVIELKQPKRFLSYNSSLYISSAPDKYRHGHMVLGLS